MRNEIRIKSPKIPTGWGPQDSVQFPYKWLNSMVYGRYNELVNGLISWFINQLTLW